MLVSIDHVQLAMPAGGEERARGFYRDVLGLAEQPKPPHLAKRGGCWFEQGTLKVHLGVEADFHPARKAHPAFLVDDIDEVAGRAEAAGFPVRWDEDLPGFRRFHTADGNGNRVELLASI